MAVSFDPAALDVGPSFQHTIGQINSTPKALMHLTSDASEISGSYRTPSQLDAEFVGLQGDSPVWTPARGYVRNSILANLDPGGTLPNTFEVSGPPTRFRLTDHGRTIAVPVAAQLLAAAYNLSVDTTALIGEKIMPGSTEQKLSPAEIRVRAAFGFLSIDPSMSLTRQNTADLLDLDLSTASSLVDSYVGYGFLQQDPSVATTCAGYARYLPGQVSANSVHPENELQKRILDVLCANNGVYVQASDIAVKAGYDVKGSGKKIANWLEELSLLGVLTKIADQQDKGAAYFTTAKGRLAMKAVVDIHNFIASPNTEYVKDGQAVKEWILASPDVVKSLIRNMPAKRGPKSTKPNTNNHKTALDEFLAKIGDGVYTTKIAQAITGSSRTATHRLLTAAETTGMVIKVPNGRELLWTKTPATTDY